MTITVKIKDIEQRLGIYLKRNYISLGCDSASKAGWCLIETDNENLNLECGSLKINSPDAMFKYQEIFKFFFNLIETRLKGKDNTIVVIEDTFFGQSVTTLKMLVRLGMTVFISSMLNEVKSMWIMPSSSRKALGFKGNLRKEEAQKQFLKKLKIKQIPKDNDIVDSVILSLNGLLSSGTNEVINA